MKTLKERLVLLFLLLCVELTATTAVDCSDQGAVYLLQIKCFKDQGIVISDPHTTSDQDYYEKRRLWLEALIAQTTDTVCSRQHEFQAAMECDHNITVQCVHPEHVTKLPVKTKMLMVVPVVCDPQHQVNFECGKKKASSLLDCDVPKNMPVSGSEEDTKAALCKGYLADLSCQLSVLRDCGCFTMRAHDLISRQLLYPPFCAPLPKQAPMICEGGIHFAFMGSRAGNLSTGFALPLCIAVIVFMIELFD